MIGRVLVALVKVMLIAHLVHCRGPHHPRGERIHSKHSHYTPSRDSQMILTQDAELLHDMEHIKEHLEEEMEEPDLSKMTDDEIEFYYFKVHDTDKNHKLDGIEILKAILHTTEENSGEEQTSIEDFQHYVDLIDRLLIEDDVDSDGYLTYPEFVSGRKKAIAASKEIQPSVKLI